MDNQALVVCDEKEKDSYGTRLWSPQEKLQHKALLDQALGEEHLALRKGGGKGIKLSQFSFLKYIVATYTYIEGWKGIEVANGLFGFNGWSCSIIEVIPDIVCDLS